MSEITKEIVSFYKEIGKRPTLVEWRQNLPADVRRMWLRRFISEVGTKKLGEPAFESLLLKYIDASTAESIQSSRQKIEQLSLEIEEELKQLPDRSQRDDDFDFDDDGPIDRLEEKITEEYERLDFLIYRCITDTHLEEFAQQYFTSFEMDQEAVDIFFADRCEASRVIGQTIQAILRDINFASRQSVYPISSEDQEKAAASVQGIVITGSSAIGPRTKDYVRKQDLDLFVVPTPRMPGQEHETWWSILSNLLHDINNAMRGDYSQNRAYETPSDELKRFLERFPQWRTVVEFLREKNITIDIYLADLENICQDGDWVKWCGPHKVGAIVGSDWGNTYNQYLQQAIQAARKEVEPYLKQEG